VLDGVDKLIPVDVYVPGCPPTPQALIHGLITLQEKINAQSLREVSWYQKGSAGEYVPVPVLGPDLVDLRQLDLIRKNADRAIADPVAKMERKPEAPADAVAAAAAG
jgi:hypothetical protein